jgi:hypothetical protein
MAFCHRLEGSNKHGSGTPEIGRPSSALPQLWDEGRKSARYRTRVERETYPGIASILGWDRVIDWTLSRTANAAVACQLDFARRCDGTTFLVGSMGSWEITRYLLRILTSLGWTYKVGFSPRAVEQKVLCLHPFLYLSCSFLYFALL